MVPLTDLVKLQGSLIWGVVFAVRTPLHVIAAYLFAISIWLIGMHVGCLVSGVTQKLQSWLCLRRPSSANRLAKVSTAETSKVYLMHTHHSVLLHVAASLYKRAWESNSWSLKWYQLCTYVCMYMCHQWCCAVLVSWSAAGLCLVSLPVLTCPSKCAVR